MNANTRNKMANVAQSTGTRIETAARHMIAVKVSLDTNLLFTRYEETPLLKNKFKYCLHKDDIAISCGKALSGKVEVINNQKHAYPAVISSLSDCCPQAVAFLNILFHHSTSYAAKHIISNYIQSDPHNFLGILPDSPAAKTEDMCWIKKHITDMPEMRFMGVSVGLGYAHPSSGDNVVSTQIGGMITILNGAFPICCGDDVQWYFEFEDVCFKDNGERNDRVNFIDSAAPTYSKYCTTVNGLRNNKKNDALENRRKSYFDMQNGNFGAQSNGKIHVARPKVFFKNQLNPRIFDQMRIFGKAVSNARPYEMVDIMICRQSL